MDDEGFNVDTVDVLAITIGGLIGLWLLPADPGWWLERVVVPVVALGALTAKRFLLPTLPPRRDTHPLLRMVFLFLSIVGTVCTLGGGAMLVVDVPDLDGSAFGWPQERVRNALLVCGVGLMLLSTLLDRAWLKGASRAG